MEADCLVLLSDIDGLYTADPRRDPNATHIPVVAQMTDDIMSMGGEPPPGYSSGGMRTKLLAAKIATRAGANMVITAGQESHPLRRLAEGGPCTWFLALTDAGSARKRWIGGSLQPKGSLTIDTGAEQALKRGASLLPAGVNAVDGAFNRGDLVLIRRNDGAILGRGLIAYDSEESKKLIGHRSTEMEDLLGYRGRDALIHRDDLALETY